LQAERTTVDFAMGSVPHTVHGMFRLKRGASRLT
jgi:hypothetical protein